MGKPPVDPEMEAEQARRLALHVAASETRWRDLFNRQQAERDSLYEPGIVNRVQAASFIYRALRAEKPGAGLVDTYNVMASEKLRLELAGRHQLRERKDLAREVKLGAAKVRREVAEEFSNRPSPA